MHARGVLARGSSSDIPHGTQLDDLQSTNNDRSRRGVVLWRRPAGGSGRPPGVTAQNRTLSYILCLIDCQFGRRDGRGVAVGKVRETDERPPKISVVDIAAAMASKRQDAVTQDFR